MRFAKHPDVLLDWREGEHRTTKHDTRYGLDRFRETKLRHLLPHLRAEDRPIRVVGAGTQGKRFLRGLQGAGIVVQALHDTSPTRIGQQIAGVPVLAADALPEPDEAFLVVALAAPGAREAARGRFVAGGRVELRDFLCVQ